MKPGATLGHSNPLRPRSLGVYLDGKKVGVADDYIVKNTHDNVLRNVYAMKPGEHTVRLVTTGDTDPRSKGKKVSLNEAVVYRAAN